jgi:protein XRP2
MEDAKAILDKKPFADKCFFLRFDDQEHGFMAARGDYSKPEIAAAAGKGLEILANFFTQRMAS